MIYFANVLMGLKDYKFIFDLSIVTHYLNLGVDVRQHSLFLSPIELVCLKFNDFPLSITQALINHFPNVNLFVSDQHRVTLLDMLFL